MTAHRPLSEWVTALPLTPAGTAQWDPGREVNFGDERADARELPRFAGGWRRQAVPLDLGFEALGLVHDTAPYAVVELDSTAWPVRTSREAAGVIAGIEDGWPAVTLSPAQTAVLAGEALPVRYLLLARLAAEAQPPPQMFHLLPWDRVSRLAAEVTAILGGGEPAPEIAVLGHWFTPAGSRLTAALEQLDEGLRRRDPALARVAATALCTRALAADAERLPSGTRTALASLLTALRRTDALMAFAAARASQHLSGGSGQPEASPVRLPALLPAAADTSAGIRRESAEALRGPFLLRLTVTGTGRTEVSLRAPLPPGRAGWLAGTYGVPLQPVVVTGTGPTRYLVPLRYADGELSGRLSVATPPGRTVEADVAGPPIGAAEAVSLTPAEVARSIRGLTTRSSRALWADLASLLPAAHPLRAVIARETQ